MDPITVTAILTLVETAIAKEPELQADFIKLFQQGNPTPADWQGLRQKFFAKAYRDYVPATAIPASAPTPAPVPAAS